MRRILRAIVSGIGITLMLAMVLSATVWLLGGYVAFGSARPFETVAGRGVTIAAVWLVALVTILLILLRRTRKDDAMADAIVTTPEPAGLAEPAVSSELGEMRDKLKRALAALRKSKGGRRHLYELPWYIMIGPPGAGKTTAIVNSGLTFPLADEMGRDAVGGVGGTRNCDWWFTDGAVLVDTAGRYTTQDSDTEADNAAWLGFLSILKRHRPRQPINGAIVAISLSDLSLQDEATQKGHALAVRHRLNELREKLGVRYPVYVLFTKADLLAGFTEFFDRLGKEERGQVWGFTLPLQGKAMERFDAEYAALLGRLNDQLLGRLQDETDPGRRAMIAGFPTQVASMRGTARAFLDALFEENRYEHGHLLRGVYFTSGTQEGTPIDRLMLGMARTFGIGRQAIGSGRGTGRSYFLTRLFTGVVFRESGLVSADDRVERRYRIARAAAIAAAILGTVALGSVWLRSYMGNRALASETTAQVASFRQAAAQIPPSPVGDTDIPSVVPALNMLRDLPGNPEAGDTGAPPGLGWGLYQGDVIGTSAAQAYREALNRHLLPRLVLRLDEQLRASTNEPDYLFEALKVYLMLGQAGPMNADLIREWMQVDWQLTFPGPARDDLRADLARHMDALLSAPMTAVPLNGDLVSQVQTHLAAQQPAERVYSGILTSSAAGAVPPFRLSDVGGPSLSRAIIRSSGTPLTDGVEGIYTRAGFHDVFLKEATSVSQRIQRDAWVLGPAAGQAASEATLARLSEEVLALYYVDYAKKYDELLGDIDIIPMQNPAHAAEVTNILSGPTSPLAALLRAIAEQTRLTAPPPSAVVDAQGALDAVQGAADAAASAGGQLNPTLQRLLDAGSAETEAMAVPGAVVEEQFAWLHDFVTAPDGQPAPVDAMLTIVRSLYEELANIASGQRQGDVAALTRLRAEAATFPGPMGRWAVQIADGSSRLSAGNTRTDISALWQSTVLPFCQQATGSSYPFDKRAQTEISIQDFTRLFAPGGMIDTFFQENLADHVDIRTWTWRKVAESELGISDAVLEQFRNAASIRDAFFPAGPQPSVTFHLQPFGIQGITAAELQVHGGLLIARNVEVPPLQVTWPGEPALARLTMAPPVASSENTRAMTGPWAWFRLMDTARPTRTSTEMMRLLFVFGDRRAMFNMTPGSVINPFSLPALAAFRCPESF